MKVAPVSADLLLKMALAVGAVLAVLYVAKAAKDEAYAAFGDIGNTIGTWASDATSVAYHTANEVGEAVTDTAKEYGVSWWQLATPAALIGTAIGTTVRNTPSAIDAINPASSGNLVNRGVTATGEYFTGEAGWTLGGQIYDWTH